VTLLAVDRVAVSYGKLVALRDVSLNLDQGHTVFVSGPNGAGKSTLLKVIAGTVKPRHGEVRLAGERIDSLSPEQIARLGISMVPEGRDVFGSLTIEENLRVGVGMRRDRDQAARDLEDVYTTFPPLRERRHSPAGVLSGGQQQMLVIGRALMAGPRVIAIDEPSLGLAPRVIDDVYASLLRLRDARGLTLLIVEQSATRALLTGGEMILLRGGAVIMQGDARELIKADALKSAYFGYDDRP
jgi:branched-chain amino acid transport system ATP-binding protein